MRELKILCDLQIDTGLSKHFLLLGWCWSITCHSTLLLYPTSSTVYPVWYCDRVDADHRPRLSVVQPTVRQGLSGVLGCKWVHAFDDWEMHPSSLYLCIQAALCCSHSQWQEMETKEKSQSFTSNHNYCAQSLTCEICSTTLRFHSCSSAWKILVGVWFSMLFFSMVHVKLLSLCDMATWLFIEQSKVMLCVKGF